MENSEPTFAEQPAAGKTPGEMLRTAREAQGISAREMADRLNWMPTYVEAIEANQFDVLRGRAFVLGYLRNYGKLVSVPEAELLAALDAMNITDDEPSALVGAPMPRSGIQQPVLGIAIGVVAALLLVFVFWLLQDDEPEQTAASVPVEITSPAVDEDEAEPQSGAPALDDPVLDDPVLDERVLDEPVSLAETAAQVAAPDNEQAQTELTETPVQRSQQVQQAALAEEELAEQSASAEALAERPSSAGTAAPVEVTDAVLQFAFSGDCWVEVRDASDRLIYADLRRDGDQLALDGEAPFNILVGDARMVELRYLDEPFEITTRPGRVIARFSVGDIQ